MAKVTYIKDIFKPVELAETSTHVGNITIRQWLIQNKLEGRDKEVALLCSVNGEYILTRHWSKKKIRKNDVVVFVENPAGAEWFVYFVISAIVAAVAVTVMTPVPQSQSNMEEGDSVYYLTGHRNQYKLGQPIECPYGRNRLWPTYAAKSYSKFIGNEQYNYSLLNLGHGYYDVEQVRIDDTPINNFPEVYYTIYQPGEEVSMFPDNVIVSPEISNVELFGPNESEYEGWTGPFTVNPAGTTTTLIEFDLTLPTGLYTMDEDRMLFATVTVLFQYREVDQYTGVPTGIWTNFGDGFTIQRKTNTAQRFTLSYNLPAGRYEVRGQRSNNAATDVSTQDTLYWYALKAYLPSTKDYGGITLLAIEAKATNNLNSASSNKINVIATRKLPIWDGEAWSTPTATRSLVWAFCDVFRAPYAGNYASQGLDVEGFDLEALLVWDTYFTEKNIYFDYVFDKPLTIWEMVKIIARAGMATPTMVGTQISLAVDRPEELPVGVFNKENIVQGSFREEHSLYDLSEYTGIEVEYIDGVTFEKETVQCLVGDDSDDHLETIQFLGVSDLEVAYHWGMRTRSQQKLLRKNYIFSTGMEGLLLNFGDLILVGHDQSRLGISGLISSVNGNIITLDREVVFESGSYQIGFRKKDGSYLGPYPCYGNGRTSQVVLNSVLPTGELKLDDLPNNSSFILGPAGESPKMCKVVSVSPNGPEDIEVRCVEYKEEVYSFDEVTEDQIPTGTYSGGYNGGGGYYPWEDAALPLVNNLVVVNVENTLNRARASWISEVGALYFIVEKSVDNLSWTSLGVTNSFNMEFTVVPDYHYVRVAAVGKGQGPWSLWQGELGGEFIPNIINSELEFINEWTVIMDQRAAQIEAEAERIAAEANQAIEGVYATIERNDQGYGSTFQEIRQVIDTGDGELVVQINALASAHQLTQAGVLEQSQALASLNSATAQKFTVVDSRLDSYLGMINAQSQVAQEIITDVERVGIDVTNVAQSLEVVNNSLVNDYVGIDAYNTAITGIRSDINYVGGQLTQHNSHIVSLNAFANGVGAKVETLSNAFITTGPGGQLIASAGYRLKVDANGVAAGFEAIAKNDPNSPPLSIMKFSAGAFYFEIDGKNYRLTEGYPVMQQIGGGTAGGDSTWRIRNVFTPQFIPIAGNYIGDTAQVKIYGDHNIDSIELPASFFTDLENTLSILNTGIGSLNQQVTDLNNSVATQIGAVNTNLTNLNQEIVNTNNALDTTAQQTSNLQTTVNNQGNTITDLGNSLTTLNQEIVNTNDALLALQNEIK